MLIDWFTVGAQIFNFLVLVWLMKRFLYKPVLHAIDEREKLIAKNLADADDSRIEAAQVRDDFTRKNQEFDQHRASLMRRATDEAEAERHKLLDAARLAAVALTAKHQETMNSEARNLLGAIRSRTQEEVFAIARKALKDLASTGLEERMVDSFLLRVGTMDGEAKANLASALTIASDPVVVRSAFDLSPEERTRIQDALNQSFAVDARIRYVAAPDVVGGIELTAGGQKISWSIAGYLASLEKGVEEILSAQANPGAESTSP